MQEKPMVSEQNNLNSFLPSQRLKKVRVLLVEDGLDHQAFFEHFLKASGASVDIAKNGQEGVDKALASSHDVVLMDIQMPVLDGYEATKRLRAAGYKKPILALTAHAMRIEREKCLTAGCNGYISKPVKPHELIEMIALLVGKTDTENSSRKFSRFAMYIGNFFRRKRPDFARKSRSVKENDTIIRTLLNSFFENLITRRDAMLRAQKSAKWKEVAALAHQISGAAGGFGFPNLRDVTFKIENLAKEDPPNEVALQEAIKSFEALSSKILNDNR